MSTRLIEAAYAQRLGEVARVIIDDASETEEARLAARTALDACDQIDERARREAVEIEAIAKVADPEARLVSPEGLRQRHAVTIDVGSSATAVAVAERLESEGFEAWDRWSGAARRSFLRYGTHFTLARTDSVSVVARVRWARHPSAGWRSRAGRVLRPTAGDWSMAALPDWAWPVYSVIRPVRQVLERVGVRQPHADSLGPFLATPEALLEPLLAFADVGPDDVVVDIGCGDARLPVAASVMRCCQSIGIEKSPELAERGRRRAEDSGVDDLVKIITGEAQDTDLSEATVVFMFLPADVVPDLLPGIRSKLRPGARIVTHEQSRPQHSPEHLPDRTELLVSDGGVTVAHRWDV